MTTQAGIRETAELPKATAGDLSKPRASAPDGSTQNDFQRSLYERWARWYDELDD